MWDSLSYIGLFISSFISATIIPFSSEVVLAYLYHEGYAPLAIIIVASIGNTLGGMTGYLLGLGAKWSLLEKYFGIKEAKIMAYTAKAERYGKILALLCWLPFIGDFIAVALGFAKVKWKEVLIYMFIGKLIRYIYIIGLTAFGIDLLLH
jgi:membrane protein YqaA with SNARE-associated domain